MNVERGIEKEL